MSHFGTVAWNKFYIHNNIKYTQQPKVKQNATKRKINE